MIDLHKNTDKELNEKIEELRIALIDKKFDLKSGISVDINEYRKLKMELAQSMTIINERKSGIKREIKEEPKKETVKKKQVKKTVKKSDAKVKKDEKKKKPVKAEKKDKEDKTDKNEKK